MTSQSGGDYRIKVKLWCYLIKVTTSNRLVMNSSITLHGEPWNPVSLGRVSKEIIMLEGEFWDGG